MKPTALEIETMNDAIMDPLGMAFLAMKIKIVCPNVLYLTSWDFFHCAAGAKFCDP
jgi:hypothetical protein